jgi:putative ABC transport system permease protein
MTTQGGQSVYVVATVRGTLNDHPTLIEGRSAADLAADLSYTGNWRDDASVALLPPGDTHAVGDLLTLRVNDQTQTVTVIGTYTRTVRNNVAALTDGVIVPRSVAEALGGARTQVQVIGAFPVEQLDAATTGIGTALPDALVFSRADLNDWMATTYRSLFTFAVSIAGLAFVAGAVLIGNSTGLTVVERRGEIGVLKAVGYTSGHVLRLLLAEYGFLGTLAGGFGVAGAIIAILLINDAEGVSLIIEPSIVGGMLLLSIGIALASAAVIAWQPTHVRPLDVLRYE